MKNIIIVGGGIAGLSAADQLANHHSIIIIEARDRIGGRIHTIQDNVDVGGQWVGKQHTCLLRYIHKYKLNLVKQFYIPSNTYSDCINYQRKNTQSIDDFIAFIEHNHLLKDEWDFISIEDFVKKHFDNNQEILLFAQTVLACNPKNVSFYFFMFYIKSSGGIQSLGDGDNGAQRWRVDEGMQSVCLHLADDLQKRGVKIIYNTEVISIYDHIVIDNKNRIYTGDHIILALSPSFSQKIHVDMPLSKKLLYKNFIKGHVIKCIVIYHRAWWLTQSFSGDVTGPIDNIFHTTVHGYPALICLITGDKVHHIKNMKETVCQQLAFMYDIKEEPYDYIEKQWTNEKYSAGCFAGLMPPNGIFSFYQHHLITPHQHVHYASTELTFEYNGYIEGAIRSGYRAASEIDNYL